MSYRRSHIKNKIFKIKEKKPIFKKLWFWLAILIILVISTIIYFVVFFPGLDVKNVNIHGSQRLKAQDVNDFVTSSKDVVLVDFWDIKIVSRNIILANTKKIRSAVLDRFPEVESVVIKKNYPNSLDVFITERNPLGAFCDNENKCFLIDYNGIIFEALNPVPDNTLIIRQALQPTSLSIGKTAVKKEIMGAIFKISTSLTSRFNIAVKEALITSPVRLNVKTSEGWVVYFDLTQGANVDSQIYRLETLLEGDYSQQNRQSLRYIDLRPNDRAIICDNSICG